MYINQLLYLLQREKEKLFIQGKSTQAEEICTKFLSFIHKRILKEIEFLLCHSDVSIKQIASQLNFDSASQLSRFFKHHNQIPPKIFRARTK